MVRDYNLARGLSFKISGNSFSRSMKDIYGFIYRHYE